MIGVIGIDGADFDITRRMIERGHLPNMKALSYDGQVHRIKTYLPAMSASVWTTYTTGVNPGRHGILDFFKTGSVTKLKISTDVTVPRIWDILSKHCKSCLVMNVPVTYPPKPVNGILVSGVMSKHNDGDTYPTEYKSLIQPYVVEPSLDFERGIGNDIEGEMYRVFNLRVDAFLRLLAHRRYDFFFVVFNIIDRGSHYYYGEQELEKMYMEVDKVVGKISRICAGWDLLCVSDHGFRRIHTYFFIEEWLRRRGCSKVSVSGQTVPNFVIKGLSKFSKIIPRSRELQRRIYHKYFQKRSEYHPGSPVYFYSNSSRYLLCKPSEKDKVLDELSSCQYVKYAINGEEHLNGPYVNPETVFLVGADDIEIIRGFGDVTIPSSGYTFFPTNGTHRWGGAICLGNMKNIPETDTSLSPFLARSLGIDYDGFETLDEEGGRK